jgi:hypothetical protein
LKPQLGSVHSPNGQHLSLLRLLDSCLLGLEIFHSSWSKERLQAISDVCPQAQVVEHAIDVRLHDIGFIKFK